jgi:phosphoserine phosphatase
VAIQTYDETRQEDPTLFATWLAAPQLARFPGGESLQDLASRAANALRMVLARHPDEVIVMVGHDSVNRALLLGFLGQPLSAYWRLAQDPCGLNEIDISGTGADIRVRRIKETAHVETIADG